MACISSAAISNSDFLRVNSTCAFLVSSCSFLALSNAALCSLASFSCFFFKFSASSCLTDTDSTSALTYITYEGYARVFLMGGPHRIFTISDTRVWFRTRVRIDLLPLHLDIFMVVLEHRMLLLQLRMRLQNKIPLGLELEPGLAPSGIHKVPHSFHFRPWCWSY